MRRLIGLAVIGVIVVAGCGSAGDSSPKRNDTTSTVCRKTSTKVPGTTSTGPCDTSQHIGK